MTNNETQKNNIPALIPCPARIEMKNGAFSILDSTALYFEPSNEIAQDAAQFLAAFLSPIIGSTIKAKPLPEDSGKPDNSILITTEHQAPELGEEGYQLEITPTRITLRAEDRAGFFYATQSLRQLLPPELQSGKTKSQNSITLPCLSITDQPAFAWRGMLLDCVRHFMTKDFIMRQIDLIAYHKLNVLHLHLTDDQGWRIEIEQYPRLTEVAAWREDDGKRYGGFYSKKDLKEIVEYAQSRSVTVIPEIEMPGHSSAAISAYPELSCKGEPIPVKAKWAVFEDVLCAGKDNTFQFLEDVLEEVIDIFPAPYIHIGGDEAPRKNWETCPHCQKRIEDEGLQNEHELQSYLIRRIERFLSERGKRLIGWDEILFGGGLPNSMIVQSWRGDAGTITAAKMGLDTICSSLDYVYFDYPLDEEAPRPAWMKVTPLEKVYEFSPVPKELNPKQADHVLGSECAMWTEYAPQELVDNRLYPRLCAFSERLWSPATTHDWDDFQHRLTIHKPRLDALGVDYYRE